MIWLATSSIGNAINNDGSNNDNGSSNGSGVGTLLALAIPGVLCQMFLRCYFIRGYFKVEEVIRRSVAKHEEETAAAAAATANSNGTSNGGNGSSSSEQEHAETNALQLQLNDLSCSLASGCGYAILHSLFLYGTLLASESGESNSYNDESGSYAGGGGSTGYGGTLYQESCGGIPSLINGALIACMFSILDVLWMMLCFFGMRRCSSSLLSLSEQSNNNITFSTAINNTNSGGTTQAFIQGLTCRGISDTYSGGNASILLVTITHLLASLVLAPNTTMSSDGCKVSLPLLGGVVLYVLILTRGVLKKGIFLPMDQRRRIQGLQLSGLRNVDQSHHVE